MGQAGLGVHGAMYRNSMANHATMPVQRTTQRTCTDTLPGACLVHLGRRHAAAQLCEVCGLRVTAATSCFGNIPHDTAGHLV